MKILNFSFKNLCSYGNSLQHLEISDKPQLVIIEGRNGSGKSTIADALTFSIYGKSTIRKTKELPNRFNKNGYTYIELLTNNNVNVKIDRGIEPNHARIAIDGIEHNLADKRKLDDFIENELIQIPFKVFSNTISLSINEFKSFIKLSPNDKRQIIDKIFGLEILNDILKLIKQESLTLRTTIATIDQTLSNNSVLLENSLADLKILKEGLTESKATKIDELHIEIKKLEENKAKAQQIYVDINSSITEIDAIVKTSNEVRLTNHLNIQNLQSKIKIYESNVCPHCLSDLTDQTHQSIKEQLLLDKTLEEKEYSINQEKVVKAQSLLTEKQNILSKARDKFYQLDTNLSYKKRELSQLQLEIDSTTYTNVSYVNAVIKSIESTIDKANIERTQSLDQLNLVQELEEVIPGMKQLLMQQIIPILNAKLLNTAKFLEFPFAFEFDIDFNPYITHLGIDISPDSLSAGEQKKMNLIVLLGIIELIKLKHHSVNIMFLDEIFSSLDVESIYKVVDLLKSFSEKYNMSIFAISHDPLPEELFDKKIIVKKIDHFSTIEIS